MRKFAVSFVTTKNLFYPQVHAEHADAYTRNFARAMSSSSYHAQSSTRLIQNQNRPQSHLLTPDLQLNQPSCLVWCVVVSCRVVNFYQRPPRRASHRIAVCAVPCRARAHLSFAREKLNTSRAKFAKFPVDSSIQYTSVLKMLKVQNIFSVWH